MSETVYLIVGGAIGIGAEVVRQVARTGTKVAICDINQQAGELLAEEVGGLFIYCDVTSNESVVGAVAVCVEKFGVPDYVHINAGVITLAGDAPFQAFEDVPLDVYRRVMSVNVDGVFHGLRTLVPLMREKGGGITVTASRAGIVATPFDPIYAASKAAVVQMVRSVAGGNAMTALRINTLCPGTVDTGMVPNLVRQAGIPLMAPEVMAEEAVYMMKEGENGEVRVKLADRPSFTIGEFNADVEYVAPTNKTS